MRQGFALLHIRQQPAAAEQPGPPGFTCPPRGVLAILDSGDWHLPTSGSAGLCPDLGTSHSSQAPWVGFRRQRLGLVSADLLSV